MKENNEFEKHQAAKKYYDAGQALALRGRYEEAINNFNKTIELNPNTASSYYHKGQCLYRLKRLAEAIKAYDDAISLRPRDAKSYNNKGKCLYELGRLWKTRGVKYCFRKSG